MWGGYLDKHTVHLSGSKKITWERGVSSTLNGWSLKDDFIQRILSTLKLKHTVREVFGAEGLVSDTISWIASLSLRRWSGLEIPISRWISVSDKADIMAPLLTFARQAATYHAGMPTHNCLNKTYFSQIFISYLKSLP